MAIVLARIDDRLIHGQVVEGWLKPLQGTHLIVVSDEAAQDSFQQALFKMALPKDIQLSVFPIETAARELPEESKRPASKAIVLFPSPREPVDLVRLGVRFQEINVGGMHYSFGKKQISQAVSLGSEDREQLLALVKAGVRVEGRALPTDKRLNFSELLDDDGIS